MKCLKGPVPRVVATASGEAAADQEMAHLLLAQELSGISRSDELLVFFHCASILTVHHLVKIRPGPERRLGDGLPRPHGRVPCHLAVN